MSKYVDTWRDGGENLIDVIYDEEFPSFIEISTKAKTGDSEHVLIHKDEIPQLISALEIAKKKADEHELVAYRRCDRILKFLTGERR